MSNKRVGGIGFLFMRGIFYLAILILLGYLIVPHTRLYYSNNPFLPSFHNLNKTDLVMKVGEEYKLYVVGVHQRATFQSTDIKVATVNINGKVSAYRAGTTYIKVKCNKKSYKCRVRVIRLNKKKVKLRVNQTYKLKVKHVIFGVSYRSSSSRVATVSRFGRIRAKEKGKATIIARYKGKKLKCRVIVR